jgi:hypothetical protein
MIVNTQARTGTKRTRPRLQSGEAVKNVQPGTARLEKIEDCDQDLKRIRENNSRSRIRDLEMIFRLSTVQHDIARLLAYPYYSFEEASSFHRDSEEACEVVPDNDVNDNADTRRTKRTKPRSQSGPAVAHLDGKSHESKVVALASTAVELHDKEVLTAHRGGRVPYARLRNDNSGACLLLVSFFYSDIVSAKYLVE